jgi:hypothetical protein
VIQPSRIAAAMNRDAEFARGQRKALRQIFFWEAACMFRALIENALAPKAFGAR